MTAIATLIAKVMAITAEPHRGLHEPHGTKDELRKLALKAEAEMEQACFFGWERKAVPADAALAVCQAVETDWRER